MEVYLKLSDQRNKPRTQTAMGMMLVHAVSRARFVYLDDALDVARVRVCLVLAGEHRTYLDQIVLLQETRHFAELETIADPRGCVA
jgi:hypothetical protein